MERIAAFEKVSWKQFHSDMKNTFPDWTSEQIQKVYDSLQLPRRATAGSAGYDFYAPFPIRVEPGAQVLIPTGIRARIDSGYVLMLFPRSSLGFKYRLQLNNTVGVIDSDYRGQFIVALHNHGSESQTVGHGERIAQLVITPVITPGFIETEQLSDTQRGEGGFGSTGK